MRCDLHIHSCLSPCASLALSPAAIIAASVDAGLDCIAMTDHNCAENLPAFGALIEESPLAGLFGLEVNTLEEAHVLCLFDRLPPAMALGREVYAGLPQTPHDHTRFGDQVVVDRRGGILAWKDRFLGAASAFGLDGLTERVRADGGLVIPSHIDRPSCSVISQLGFLPLDSPFDAVEVAFASPVRAPALPYPYPVVFNSDAHTPEDIGRRSTDIDADNADIPSLRAALRAHALGYGVREAG